jgi:hypothetical protein
MNEFGHVEIRLGTKEDQPQFWEVAGAYAPEIVVKAEEEIQRGVDGTQVPFTPCSILMRMETALMPIEPRFKESRREREV